MNLLLLSIAVNLTFYNVRNIVHWMEWFLDDEMSENDVRTDILVDCDELRLRSKNLINSKGFFRRPGDRRQTHQKNEY